MAADPVFIDTNVLIYATRRTASEHAVAQGALARLEGEGRSLWISFQILREYLAAVTRPRATSGALSMRTAIADVRRFQQVFCVAEDQPAVLDRLLALLGAHLGAGRSGTRHQYRGNDARARHSPPTDVQRRRLQALRGYYRVRADAIIV
jgi:predicted nucleic acid-binding protein